ncbi:hypothetical protein GQ42DRAFT_1236, partial [Ramicandelaber brevisporus]
AVNAAHAFSLDSPCDQTQFEGSWPLFGTNNQPIQQSFVHSFHLFFLLSCSPPLFLFPLFLMSTTTSTRLQSSAAERLRVWASMYPDSPSACAFRLPDLPFDLLLYLTDFFAREEAVCIITVSTGFHDIFARSIWRHIVLNNSAIDVHPARNCTFERYTFEPSASSWSRYGHLVQSVLVLRANDDAILQLIPNVRRIILNVDRMNIDVVFSIVSKLRNLVKVRLSAKQYRPQLIESIASWANNDSRSGHVRVIELAQRDPRADNTHILESVRKQLIDTNRVRYGIFHSFKGTLNRSLLDAVSSLIFKLEVKQPSSKFATLVHRDPPCTALLKRELLGDPTVTFSRLRELRLSVCCHDPAKFDYSTFTPERFPILKKLMLHIENSECDANLTDSVITIFSSTWHSLTHLSLHDIHDENMLPQVLDRVPNLIRLKTYGQYNVDVIDTIDRLPRIQELSIMCTIIKNLTLDPSALHQLPLRRTLKVIELNATFAVIDQLRFMLAASPCLEYARFDIRYLNVQGSSGRFTEFPKCRLVTSLDIVCHSSSFGQADIVEYVELFPNLCKLKLEECEDSIDEKVRSHFPSLNVETKEAFW